MLGVKRYDWSYSWSAEIERHLLETGDAMQFSIRSILILTVIAALVSLAYVQQQRTVASLEKVVDLSTMIDDEAPLVKLSAIKVQIANNFLETTPHPSSLLQSMQEDFPRIQRKYGSFAETPTTLATQYVPESNAAYYQRHQARVFVPENESVQLRLAVFPCTEYRPRDSEPISDAIAKTILTENPFSPPGHVYLAMDSGEHTVLVEWHGLERRIKVFVDDLLRYQTVYTRELKTTYKYMSLGGGPALGFRQPKPEDDVIGIRYLCPAGSSGSETIEHTWRCELVRGSALGEAAAE